MGERPATQKEKNIQFTKIVPKFLQQFTKKESSIESKLLGGSGDNEGKDRDDKDDELPVIVGTEEEIQSYTHQQQEEKEKEETKESRLDEQMRLAKEAQLMEKIEKKRKQDIESGKKKENPDVDQPILFRPSSKKNSVNQFSSKKSSASEPKKQKTEEKKASDKGKLSFDFEDE
eukprot:TRINITY_DN2497_c0_g1_i1.p1 TRINITY_DN2497_c0_g1~~TRINITY_DN2497_c0_g1_i1.p1  ORF type:complete len:174 (+),score=92.10 TRINITY_DN2497_c0_g1_i1:63-584(+)